VLTGESGSGKTAFLSGLKLLVGERGSADMVREGAESLEVQGRFFLHGGAEDGTVASRSLTADGRSRVRMDGRMASVGDLSATVGASVDLCGQHEHQRLTKAASQAGMLDAWIGAGLEDALAGYRQALAESVRVHRAHEELLRLGTEGAAQVEEARFTLRRIDEVDPQEGEYEELVAAAKRLENQEELLRSTVGAHEALTGEGGALDALNTAISVLESAVSFDERLRNPLKALREDCYLVEDVARDVDALMPDADAFDPAEMAQLQDRVAAFQGLMRTYGPTMDEVFARRGEAARIVESVDDFSGRIAASEKALAEAERKLAEAADALSAVRRSYVPSFEEAVNGVLAQLEMKGCALSCCITRLERNRWGKLGPDAVEFLFSPGSGLAARPLAKIASGGELSRVTLAVKSVMGDADEVETLVFDEVDAGVGGKAAVAVGEVLRGLARTHQVIVVTHLAQVAVMADRHYLVSKEGGDLPETTIEPIEGEARVSEVARMLSGDQTQASLEHAREMLAGARGQ
jgi:DNA repair protein RecN (Recombination protein N)